MNGGPHRHRKYPHVLWPGDISDSFQTDPIQFFANTWVRSELNVVNSQTLEIFYVLAAKVRKITGGRSYAEWAKIQFKDFQDLRRTVLSTTHRDDAVPTLVCRIPILIGYGLELGSTLTPVDALAMLKIPTRPTDSFRVKRQVGL